MIVSQYSVFNYNLSRQEFEKIYLYVLYLQKGFIFDVSAVMTHWKEVGGIVLEEASNVEGFGLLFSNNSTKSQLS